jgi:DNA-binding protein H-NS
MHTMLQAALRPVASTPSGELGLAEIDKELAQLRIQRQRIDERERALLLALGEVGSVRTSQLAQGLQANGLSLQGVLRSALESSSRKPVQDLSKLAQAFVRKAPLKFRHPEKPALVWSGRGKTPAWISELDRLGRLEEARLIFEDSGAEDHTDRTQTR